MTKKRISVVDYGVSNILNVTRAVTYLGYSVEVITTANQILSSDMIILPGVGAFADAMTSLQGNGLDHALLEFIKIKERPLFGICLGMQLLLESSSEFGDCKGLGLIEGNVVKIPEYISPERARRVPHVGWNYLELSEKNNKEFKRNLFENIKNGESVYFVHSYMAAPKNMDVVSSFTDYEGIKIPSSLALNNLAAAQFHPERSGKTGLSILENFIKNY